MKQKISAEELAPTKYRVIVTEGSTSTVHEVTVTAADRARYGANKTPVALLEASFAFLLQREPKESILPRFALPDIERYFPDFPKIMRAPY